MIRGGSRFYARNPATVKRDAEIVLRFLAGETMPQIGEAYGISRERVRQCLYAMGLDADAGGVAVRTFITAREKQQAFRLKKMQREEGRARRLYGVGAETVYAITGVRKMFCANGRHCHPILKAYASQKRNAKTRGIAWELSLESWWAIWRDSGRWEERGRGNAYCMARWADDGPYSVENVYICTNSQNIKDGYITKPADMRAEKRKATLAAKEAACSI